MSGWARRKPVATASDTSLAVSEPLNLSGMINTCISVRSCLTGETSGRRKLGKVCDRDEMIAKAVPLVTDSTRDSVPPRRAKSCNCPNNLVFGDSANASTKMIRFTSPLPSRWMPWGVRVGITS